MQMSLLRVLDGFRGEQPAPHYVWLSPTHTMCLCRTWGNMCVVSVAHRFIWLPIPKTGSSSVRNLLARMLCCNNASTHPGCADTAHPLFLDPCPRDVLQVVHCSRLTSSSGELAGISFKEFFFFSVIRSPFTRALSSWNYGRMCYNNWLKPRAQEAGSYPPYPSLGKAMESGGYETLPPEFLKEFETAHLGSQVPFLVDVHTRLPAVDMVLRTESLESDFLCLFRHLGLVTAATPRPARLRSFKMDHCKVGLPHLTLLSSYYAQDFLLLSGLGGYTQVQCSAALEAVVLAPGCTCSSPKLHCLCRKPESISVQCDVLSCSDRFTQHPCHSKLCPPAGSALNVPLNVW